MRKRLQDVIDRVPPGQYEAILLGYALCGNGIAGLASHTVPLVIPRAHDCIALLMGGRDRYQQYFDQNPGTYFRSTGWLERGENLEQATACHPLTELIRLYGEENGRYLFEQFNGYERQYRQLTYIATGLEPDGSFEQRASEEASRRGWQFDRIEGSLGLFERLLAGDWDGCDFLVVEPGWRVTATYDERIIDKERAA